MLRTGIAHGEFNHSATDPVHFLQIWITPGEKGLEPSYEDLPSEATQHHGLTLVGSPEGGERCVTVHQDVRLYFGRMNSGEELMHVTAKERGIWIQVIQGEVKVADQVLAEGDGISIENLGEILLSSASPAQFLLFDLK